MNGKEKSGQEGEEMRLPSPTIPVPGEEEGWVQDHVISSLVRVLSVFVFRFNWQPVCVTHSKQAGEQMDLFCSQGLPGLTSTVIPRAVVWFSSCCTTHAVLLLYLN